MQVRLADIENRFCVPKIPEAAKLLQQLVNEHGKAKALSILAKKLGRAVYVILKRRRAFDMNKFLSD